ncbi:uncharacterized protein AC631_03448 [Debaryomyces fabryi]|uniref:FAD-binding PCMH-type domain-containing protein n=1 Tax=Debaryomyces fabryi TaxID=58627 RepID=A0A0V1PXW5_9ASCO|nr:uncharacterized protein AC631_03448 [Debaryomyces fabryi]KSA00799.1 hypothetical protein AC631_03448 [Debaryomyces fabryi]CUM55106.1 unnamed protein product [Debaryomyces fabryi]
MENFEQFLLNPNAQELARLLPITWKNSDGFENLVYSRVFNLRVPTRLPIAIIQVKEENDIINGVKLANILNLKVSVISGGHSWAVWGVREDALMLDLGNYKEIRFNDETRTVTASTSIDGRTLNSYLLKNKHRFFPGGHCPDVGIGGFLLQGGMGWCCRGWGWACERIKSLRAVTADGKLLTCSETENSDLFWVARGCGPGFPGIVSTFELETIPEKVLYSATYIYDISKFKEVMNWIVKVSPTTDQDVETVVVTSVPEFQKKPVVTAHIVSFKDLDNDCITELRKYENSKPPGALSEIFGKKTSLEAEYEAQANANPKRHRYRTDNVYLRSDVNVADVLEQSFTTIPNQKTFCLYLSMDPLTKLKDMALSMQTEHYVAIYAVSDNKEEDDQVANWMSRSFQSLEKYSAGAYLGDSDFQIRKTPFWGAEQHLKLNKLRDFFDPKKRFCGYLKDPINEKKNNELSLHEVLHSKASL